MTVSRDNSKAVYQGIKDAGIRSISALPETWLVYLLQLASNDPEMTLIVHGYQWYWGYEYPDQQIPEYESRMVQEGEEVALHTVAEDHAVRRHVRRGLCRGSPWRRGCDHLMVDCRDHEDRGYAS